MRHSLAAMSAVGPLLLAACSGSVGRLPADAVDAGTIADAGEDVSDAGETVDGGHDSDAGVDAGMIADDAGMDAGTDAGFGGAPFVFVGSGGGRIDVFELDLDAGTLSPRGSYDGGSNPSFLAFHPTELFLYAVQEKSPGEAAAFSIDPTNGALSRLNAASSGGNGPAHINLDRSGRVVLTANYGAGTVAVLPLLTNGQLSAPSDTEAPGTKAHQIVPDPSNRFVFVPCLGSDHIAQFALDVDAGTLTPNAVPTVAAPAGAGPRHLDFHPSRKFAFVINELASSMSTYAFDEGTGRLTLQQTVSTLPSGFMGSNTCADVHVHPNGRFVYGSNRGHNSIAIFAVDEQTGALTLLDHQSTGGTTPRNFTLSADGSLMLVANQGSGTIHGFRVNGETGALTPLGELAQVPSPAFVGIRPLPRP